MLLDTAAEADCRYLALEKAHDHRFARLEAIPKNEEESQLLV